jgi:N-acetylmuramoyl-L-alanine amidase CwlA
MVQIVQQLVKDTPHKYGKSNGKRYITIHETDNFSPTADAQAHANLQSNGNSRKANWHWQVDDKVGIQSFTHDFQLWAAGDGKGDGNLNSIHVEICVNEGGNYAQAARNAAEVVKHIMALENIPLECVVQHNHWSGKHCPRFMREGSKGINWALFRNLLVDAAPQPVVQPAPPAPKPAPSAPVSNQAIVPYPGHLFKVTKPMMRGKDVERIQRAVGVTPDGIYGNDTKNAVMAYQKRKGLAADGIVGINTWNTLF